MRKFIFKSLLPLIVTLSLLSAAPKEEFRAAWLTTVFALDWPSSTTVSAQKSEMIAILDRLEQLNFNAVMFQVRPACDAFYNSTIEPWSVWLTGTEGQAPSPLYDPLQFVIDEARKRNIEVHAWFNPFRAKEGASSTSVNHIYNTHPEWVLTVGAFAKENTPDNRTFFACEATTAPTYILDPGKAAVRAYVLSVISDVATRYDIDGVHLDDYFYPYAGMNNEDAATFASESRGFGNIADWRRDNINLMIESIYDELQTINPRLKFGVSPFGIWKSGTPAGISGTSSYSKIYCDPVTWLEEQWVDYLAPQLYWPFGGFQDYGLLMPWWAGQVDDNSRHLYVGHGAHKIPNWTNEEVPNQIELNRTTTSCLGSIYFRYYHLNANLGGIADELLNTYYPNFALAPKMAWKETKPAPKPVNVDLSINAGTAILTWEAGTITSENDDAAWSYIVYKWPEGTAFNQDNSSFIASIIPSSETLTYSTTDYENYDFAVTSLDRLKNESEKATPAGQSVFTELILDFEDDSDVGNWGYYEEATKYTTTTWNSTGGVGNSGALNFNDSGWEFLIKRPLSAESGSSYTLTFDVKTEAWAHATDTLKAYVTGLSTTEPEAVVSTYSSYTQVTLSGVANAATTGYLRFNGMNNATPSSLWIDNLIFTVESDSPLPITLTSFTAEAKNGKVELAWKTASEVNNSHFTIYRNDIAIGTVEGAGTSTETNNYAFTDDQVVPSGIYIYVLADVDYSGKETRYANQAITIELNEDISDMTFYLSDAYPNPFNPTTTLNYGLPETSDITLNIFDIMGRKIREWNISSQQPGWHKLAWDGKDMNGNIVSTGVYIYCLQAGSFMETKKMVFMK